MDVIRHNHKTSDHPTVDTRRIVQGLHQELGDDGVMKDLPAVGRANRQKVNGAL